MPRLIHGFEPISYNKQLISETVEKNSPIILRNVVLQRAETKNQNGRVYPRDILSREAKSFQQLIDERRALGELDHPESTTVNLRNVSHNITAMKFDGDDLIGDIEVLTTPSGNILRELLRNGIKLGVSSRGLGSVENGDAGEVIVQDDFQLLCFDVVSNPSTQGAFLTEGKSFAPVKYPVVNALIIDFLTEINEK